MICGALTIAFNACLLHRGRGEGPRGPQRQFKGMPIPPDTTGINARLTLFSETRIENRDNPRR